MKVAVLTLTRDRLEYTQHCFAKLHEFAGCDFTHYVLDNGSEDGTVGWLQEWRSQDETQRAACMGWQNFGINRGLNKLLDWAAETDDYDVIVKLDNDCELTEPNTLRDVAALALKGNAFLSPRILGLNNPPASRGSFWIEDEEILDIPQIGGIFTAGPASVWKEFHFDETKLLDDDVQLCWWHRGNGGRCGYVKRLTANHYETTSGQHARYPEYFQRTLAEGKAAL